MTEHDNGKCEPNRTALKNAEWAKKGFLINKLKDFDDNSRMCASSFGVLCGGNYAFYVDDIDIIKAIIRRRNIFFIKRA